MEDGFATGGHERRNKQCCSNSDCVDQCVMVYWIKILRALNSLSKKFNPPPPPQDDGTGAGSVINAILTLMPEDEDDDDDEEENDETSDSQNEEEQLGTKMQRKRADNLYVNNLTGIPYAAVNSSKAGISLYPFSGLMEAYDEGHENIIELYEGRCINEMLDVHGDDFEDESVPMCPTRLGLEAREIVIKAYGSSCNRLPLEAGDEATEEAVVKATEEATDLESKVLDDKSEQENTEAKQNEEAEPAEVRLWRLERQSMENAVRNGSPAKAGRKISMEDIVEVSRSAESVNSRFQDGAFVALKQLRNLRSTITRFWSDTRQTYRLFLENNKSQKGLFGG